MRRKLLISITPCILLASCGGVQPAYPPPPQREFAAERPVAPVTFVSMADPDAATYIVRDINDTIEGSGWRWTHERPEVRVLLPRARGWRLRVDFAFPEPNFKTTGPVTVSFFVNGMLLDKRRYTHPGEQHFEKAVPAAWLRGDSPTSAVTVSSAPLRSRSGGGTEPRASASGNTESSGHSTSAAAGIDPPWIAPRDKVKLGFVLYGMGFVQ